MKIITRRFALQLAAVALVLTVALGGTPPAIAGQKGICVDARNSWTWTTPATSYEPQCVNALGASWWYNWWTDRAGVTPPTNSMFIPMVWGYWNSSDVTRAATAATITSTISGVQTTTPAIMTFNEPDNYQFNYGSSTSGVTTPPVGAFMTPKTAIGLWPQFVTAIKAANSNILIGSPASGTGQDGMYASTTNLWGPGFDLNGNEDPAYCTCPADVQTNHGPNGQPWYNGKTPNRSLYPYSWLYSFMSLASGLNLEVDFICVHPYQSGYDYNAAATALQNELACDEAIFKKPVWVTEYDMANFGDPDPYSCGQAAGQGQATQANFAWAAVQMMNALPYVQRHSWFIGGPGDPVLGFTDAGTSDTTGWNLSTVGSGYYYADKQANGGTGNYVNDPGFESYATTGVLWPWQSSGNVHVFDTINTATNPITTGQSHTGIYEAQMSGSSALYQQVLSVPAGTHHLSAWVLTSNATNAVMYIQNYAGSGSWSTTALPASTTGWTKVLFNAGNGFTSTSTNFFIGFSAPANSWIAVDDIALW